MDKEYLFSEDARKYRMVMIFVAVLCYAGFVACLVVGILLFTSTIKSETMMDKIQYFVISVASLAIAIYATWALASKYLKYFMFITEHNIEFFDDGNSHKYNIQDLKGYEIIKQSGWLMGGQCIYKLNFADKSHTVTSFKAQQFKEILDKITNK